MKCPVDWPNALKTITEHGSTIRTGDINRAFCGNKTLSTLQMKRWHWDLSFSNKPPPPWGQNQRADQVWRATRRRGRRAHPLWKLSRRVRAAMKAGPLGGLGRRPGVVAWCSPVFLWLAVCPAGWIPQKYEVYFRVHSESPAECRWRKLSGSCVCSSFLEKLVKVDFWNLSMRKSLTWCVAKVVQTLSVIHGTIVLWYKRCHVKFKRLLMMKLLTV